MLGRLTSGEYRTRLPRGVQGGKLDGINLDSRWQAPTGAAHRHSDLTPMDLFDLAYDRALTESRLWIALLASHLKEPFWSRVIGKPAERWTKAFERPTGGLYDLMSAGKYPPRDSRDSHSWFLHVTPLDHRRPLVVELTDQETRRGHPGQAVTIGPADDRSRLKVGGGSFRVMAFRRAPVTSWRTISEKSSLDLDQLS